MTVMASQRLDALAQRLREETPPEDEFYAETMALIEVFNAASTALREGVGYRQGSTLLWRVLAWANLLADAGDFTPAVSAENAVSASPHACVTPFWRTADGSWTCPTCTKRWAWQTETGAVPGVPVAVCVVRRNTWVEVPAAGDLS